MAAAGDGRPADCCCCCSISAARYSSLEQVRSHSWLMSTLSTDGLTWLRCGFG